MIELSGADVWLWGLLFYVIGGGLGYLMGLIKGNNNGKRKTINLQDEFHKDIKNINEILKASK